MILDFDNLYTKYNLEIKGVIHIGANIGEEHPTYRKFNINNIIYFEPIPNSYNQLLYNIYNYDQLNDNQYSLRVYNFALGNETKEVELIISSNEGASSSVLIPKKHLELHPQVNFEHSIKVNMERLDEVLKENDRFFYNFINIDVQGYELEVLKGSIKTLEFVDYIMTEVNIDEVYENCAKLEELDKFLGDFGFKRVETDMVTSMWGDAFYIKKK